MSKAARNASITAGLLAASALTSAVFGVSFVLANIRILSPFVMETAVVVDILSDAGLAMVAAGVIGPSMDQVTELMQVGNLVEERRRQQVHERLCAVAGNQSPAALVLAAMFEGVRPHGLMEPACRRFRAISWSVLQSHRSILTDGVSLDGSQAATDLHDLSDPCGFGQCHAFFSHSWKDNTTLKWNALTRWCEAYHSRFAEVPSIWLDKVCIDQTNIALDLQCLPVFLAGCNMFLVTSGPHYTSRLWCCIELFVYNAMMDEDSSRKPPEIILLMDDQDELRRIAGLWLRFDILNCECFRQEDKVRILGIIERYPGGSRSFNQSIQQLASRLWNAQVGADLFTTLHRPGPAAIGLDEEEESFFSGFACSL